jgi:hypothetical protein
MVTPTSSDAARAPANDADEQRVVAHYGMLVATALCGLALATGWLLGLFGVVGHATQVGCYVVAYLAGGVYATPKALTAL